MILDWRLIGGSQADTPGMLPARLLDIGSEAYAAEMAPSVKAFAGDGLILHNWCGVWDLPLEHGVTLTRQMRWDQAKVAPAKVGGYWELYRAIRTLQSVTPKVWLYLGWLRHTQPDLSELEDAIRPIVNAGAGIIIDSAGAEDEAGTVLLDNGHRSRTPSWPVALLLRSMGLDVGYEPRPMVGSPFARAADMTCFCRSDTWRRTDPDKYADSGKYVRNAEIAGPVVQLHPIDGPGVTDIERQADDVARLVAGGATVATYGGSLSKHLGLTARGVEKRAKAIKEQGVSA